jgi:ZIP family zinc transporter
LSFGQTVLLGAVAGLTIFLGLPVARLQRLTADGRAFLNALAIGVLLFLFFDVVGAATGPIERGLEQGRPPLELIALLVVGFAVGLLALVYYGQGVLRGAGQERAPLRLALLVALGIGLHNFSEGLAIGGSARHGAVSLALTLIVGFGLHNATEGFGIAAPLAGRPVPAATLGLYGLIAGGPTFAGTVVGFSFVSDALYVLFLALAGGAIVYVVGELLAAGRRLGSPAWNGWGLAVGFLVALLSDFLLTAGGL